MTGQGSNARHGFQGNYAFDSKVGLVPVGFDVSTQPIGDNNGGNTHARWPAKSSVDSWFAGILASSIRYSAHCAIRTQCCLR